MTESVLDCIFIAVFRASISAYMYMWCLRSCDEHDAEGLFYEHGGHGHVTDTMVKVMLPARSKSIRVCSM